MAEELASAIVTAASELAKQEQVVSYACVIANCTNACSMNFQVIESGGRALGNSFQSAIQARSKIQQLGYKKTEEGVEKLLNHLINTGKRSVVLVSSKYLKQNEGLSYNGNKNFYSSDIVSTARLLETTQNKEFVAVSVVAYSSSVTFLLLFGNGGKQSFKTYREAAKKAKQLGYNTIETCVEVLVDHLVLKDGYSIIHILSKEV